MNRESVIQAPAPDGRQLRQALDHARTFQMLRDKYEKLQDVPSPDLADIPLLSREEFRAAIWDRAKDGFLQEGNNSLYVGGGRLDNPTATLVPHGLFAADILAEWRPLAADDVLINLCMGSKLCPAYDLSNALATLSGASVIPFQGVREQDFARWIGLFEKCRGTAIVADWAMIRSLLQYCAGAGRTLPWVRTVICTDSTPERGATDLVRRLLPDAGVWCLYASIEAWVIGHSGPACDHETFHPLPFQHVELHEGEIVVSTLHEQLVAPVLRYRTGVHGEFTRCACGEPRPALRLRDYAGDIIAFQSFQLSRSELSALVRGLPEVDDVEVKLLDRGSPTERLRLEIRVGAGTVTDQYLVDWVRECVIQQHLSIGQAAARAPESFEVVVVSPGA
ncbi:hypothetical protein AV521_43870 [Streptomyces sp. IMTB 2501]|uniref:hypothetical protein n=1 Tax=Streptomyces sp. IMTB 2501 TaxID=1776340 RepID=UPI00096DAD01|nr:hypothetical protein [Streptomyces sp. IMTB 2501]OLZ61272.1 hypothetical protein AV521_43870 [Streptomyces sp. IMTB 2501]